MSGAAEMYTWDKITEMFLLTFSGIIYPNQSTILLQFLVWTQRIASGRICIP